MCENFHIIFILINVSYAEEVLRQGRSLDSNVKALGWLIAGAYNLTKSKAISGQVQT